MTDVRGGGGRFTLGDGDVGDEDRCALGDCTLTFLLALFHELAVPFLIVLSK